MMKTELNPEFKKNLRTALKNTECGSIREGTTVGDLNLDSLDIIEMLISLEGAYGIELNDDWRYCIDAGTTIGEIEEKVESLKKNS